ncbi:MAG TPA: hypothetical protein PK390_00870 [Fervidobacterium nodosum]|nr:hypothetical protein [Fervidobacterium nodosum]
MLNDQSIAVSGYIYCPVQYGKIVGYINTGTVVNIGSKNVSLGWNFVSFVYKNTSGSTKTVLSIYITNSQTTDWYNSNN